MIILSLLVPILFLTCKIFVHLRNTNEDLPDEIGELSVPPLTAKQLPIWHFKKLGLKLIVKLTRMNWAVYSTFSEEILCDEQIEFRLLFTLTFVNLHISCGKRKLMHVCFKGENHWGLFSCVTQQVWSSVSGLFVCQLAGLLLFDPCMYVN